MLKFILPILLLASVSMVKCSEVKEEKISAGPVCSICTTVLTAAQGLLEQNKTEAQILSLIEKELCGKLGSLNSTCVQYVEAYGRTILYELGQKIDPSIVCHHIGLCDAKPVPASKFNLPVLADKNSLNCTLCKLVFQQVVNLIKSNATEAQILALIEKDLCTALGTLSPVCKSIIDSFGPMILNYLANGVDPEKVCELIGMCTKPYYKQPVVEPVIKNTVYCTVCQYAVQFLDNELKNNKTEAAVVSALDKVCGIVPATLRDQCNSLIQTYGVYLVELLVQFADPTKVCQAIKLC
jgi:saposin